ncbi:hypothetical protein QYE76_022589 [Lolium multiflorum]|uniref:Transposase (putative) gypsy type domain-containing protein n=1 Tax=Lolium multiflorum TaxID=4521 RepID=A0AAD8VRE0_LOLMU|nr:hypothetical protein QYE76_022589 [Lolium multiflorum]
METDGGQEQDAGSSSQASGADPSDITRGAWMGSNVSEYEIDWFYRSRRIPEGVTCRLAGDEIEPVLEPGEHVVFLAHFERGFGLPVSSFFRSFLDFYKLQPHQLPGNAVFYLSCYATFMEAYIGIRPTRETFARFFALRINSVQGLEIPKPKPPVQCGSCIIGSRQQSPFFKFSGLESCRLWQGTFFYVKNNGAADLIDLPPFDPAPPTTNWGYNPKESHNETNRIIRFMKQRMKDTNICSDDIIRTFISRRVLPLQRRAHKMCEMYGPGDPTKITGLPLSKKDVVLKARQICQTAMPEDWEWGLRPLSSTNPPTQEAKDRFPGILSDRRGPRRKRGLDKFDPDPVIRWQDLKMGRTAASRLGRSPPEPSGSSDELTILEVHEHVAPLQAEAGQEFVEKLMTQGQKNKTPASDAALHSSLAPGLRALPDLPGPQLLLLTQARHHLVPALPLPPLWEAPQVRGVRPLHRQITAPRRNLPSSPRPRIPAPATSAPKKKLPAGGTFGSSRPKKKRRRKEEFALFSLQGRAGNFRAATSTPAPPPETSVPEATGATPTPPPNQGPPATTPKPPPATLKITDFLKPGASRGKAADGSASSGSQPLVLHVGPAAAVVQEKPSGLLGRIVELKREGKDLGHLLPYAQKWNDADISAATRGLGKDRLPAPDPAGPRSTEEHFTRLKRAVKEFDSAWYDATSNVVSTADARKALFEELLWEHRNLAEAHSKCQAIPDASIEALKVQVAALQGAAHPGSPEGFGRPEGHLQGLKDQAIQAGIWHAQELKAAESAAEARLNEALEDAGNANVVLQAGLEEATKALKTAEGKAAKAHKAAAEEAARAQKAAEDEVARLKAEQKEYDLLVTRTDALALRLFPDSQTHAAKKVGEHRVAQGCKDLVARDPYDHLVAPECAGLPCARWTGTFRHP